VTAHLRAAACLAALASAACATQKPPLYHWNGYDDALVQHAKSPQDQAAYVASLWTVIETCRQEGTRIPPGVQAEYGYALYEEGKNAEAIPWFDAEARDWPESQLFMQKMARNAQQRGASQPATPAVGPAGAIGGKP
jgi:hypothetical protein